MLAKFSGLLAVLCALPVFTVGSPVFWRANPLVKRAVAIFVRLSRFICRAFGVFLCNCRRLRWQARMAVLWAVTVVITAIIITLVTIQAQ
nr:MAG TPA: hypothetical protein [Caudoviricetes sp.]